MPPERRKLLGRLEDRALDSHRSNLPTAKEFQIMVGVVQIGTSVIAITAVLFYLFPVLRWPLHEILLIAFDATIMTCVTTPPSLYLYARLGKPIRDYLSNYETREYSPEERFHVLAAVVGLPLRAAAYALSCWVVLAIGVGVWERLRFVDVSVYSCLILFFSLVASGLMGSICGFILLKSKLGPLRNSLATEIGDPARRAQEFIRIPVRTKLIVSFSGLTLATLAFSISASQIQGLQSLERQNMMFQELALNHFSSSLGASFDEEAEAAALEELNREYADAKIQFGIFSREQVEALGSPLSKREVQWLFKRLDVGELRGDGSALDSTNAYSWRSLPDRPDTFLIAWSSNTHIRAAHGESDLKMISLVATSLLLSIIAAVFVARDIAAGSEDLRDRIAQFSEGDFSTNVSFESEDELGDLGRSLEVMGTSLHEIVGGVSRAIERVKQAAKEIAGASEEVTSSTRNQAVQIQEVSNVMTSINTQANTIAESTSGLDVAASESVTALGRLSETSEVLSQNAEDLTTRADGSAASIEEMIHSIREISNNTSNLAALTRDVSANTTQMAREVRTIEDSSSDLSTFSIRVMEAAELGQAKVKETAQGIETIRETVGVADEVVRNLGEQTSQIGDIADVINNIADETSLLALNAAIIAAQAGEHGRGFAVVGDEIKDLASRVQLSTKEITAVVEGLQSQASRAIDAIDLGFQSVETGVTLSLEAAGTLESINAVAHDSSECTTEIVRTIQEQVTSIGQLEDFMANVVGQLQMIESASKEQTFGAEHVAESTQTVTSVAKSLFGTVNNLVQNTGTISESAENVAGAYKKISRSISEQASSCQQTADFLERMLTENKTSEGAIARMETAVSELEEEAELLRESGRNFKL